MSPKEARIEAKELTFLLQLEAFLEGYPPVSRECRQLIEQNIYEAILKGAGDQT